MPTTDGKQAHRNLTNGAEAGDSPEELSCLNNTAGYTLQLRVQSHRECDKP